jgi:hypothetical protein
MSEPVNYGLMVAFTDESPSFVHGYEAGMLWERMRSGAVAEIEMTTHTENRDVIQRMATADGWDYEIKASGVEGWDQISLRKIKPTSQRLNPHGLRVVRPS